VVPRTKLGPGTTVGGFRIKRLLGKGGMGEVYLARQLSMDRDVALKILPTSLTMDEEAVARFLQEVRMAARLEHPNIVTAHEAGEDSGVYYLAMSYVKGDTLGDLLADGGVLEERDALAITRRVASALAHAWNKHRMLHRDIKPANIILDEDGDPKLTDMGLCKSSADRVGMTVTGTVMGTPNYMSPEQSEGREDLDFRADIYSLGATLYHMLSGNMPFDGSSMMEILRKQLSESLPDPRESNPEVSEACVGLLEIMLAKDPAKRHQSWEALIADIDCVLGGKPATAAAPASGQSVLVRRPSGKTVQPAGSIPKKSIVLGQSTIQKLHERERVRHHPPEPARKPASKTPAIAIGVAAGVLILGGIVAAVIVSGNKKRAARRAALAERRQPTPAVIEPEEPPEVAPGKTDDSKLATLRKLKLLDEAVAYAKDHPDNTIGASIRFEKVRQLAQGTPLEGDVAKQIAKLEERRKKAAVASREEAKPPEPVKVTRVAEPPVKVDPPPTQQAEVDLDAIADALLSLDFDAARELLTDEENAKPPGMDSVEWQATRELALKVADLPNVIRASVESDIGKEVAVQLNRSTLKARITGVKGTEVSAEEIIRVDGKKAGTVPHSFDLAELSVQEQFRRLGKEMTTDRRIMRGLLAYRGKAEEKAEQYLEQADSPLGRLLVARCKSHRAEREAVASAAADAAREAAARTACMKILRQVGISVSETNTKKIATHVVAKAYGKAAAKSVRMARDGPGSDHAFLPRTLSKKLVGVPKSGLSWPF